MGLDAEGCGQKGVWLDTLEDQGRGLEPEGQAGVQEGGRATLTHLGDFSSRLKYMVAPSSLA